MIEEVVEIEILEPWEKLHELEAEGNLEAVSEFVDSLSAEDQRRCLSRLSNVDQADLLSRFSVELAADIMESLPEVQAAGILENLEPEVAADIVEALPDDIGADILQEMSANDSAAVLGELDDADEADHLRELTSYDWDTAGGLMSSEYLTVTTDYTTGNVIRDLNQHAEDDGDREIQYVYAVEPSGKLAGVLRLRDLVVKKATTPVQNVMIPEPAFVNVNDNFESLKNVFEEHAYLAMPVLNDSGSLVGVVTRKAVREATVDHQTEDYLHSSGIVGGEELRSMPMFTRSRRRLAWLAPNIVLNLIAASIIAMYQDTLQAVIALAVFLPIISDMSGCSGNQAVAVSIRELTLGVIRPTEFLRIVWKEGILGIINGAVLGLILGTIAFVWKDNIYLGLVVGGALLLNTILSVLLGGMVPLLLKRFKIDPALAAGPILTTCTDMCGFFLVLSLASTLLSKLG
ncbi:MAG: magnesium transporter [Verrucomicrobiales bacterium]|nr:magnesium transporter [Verrucomicrobiales bacterium]